MASTVENKLSALVSDEVWEKGQALFKEGAVLDIYRSARHMQIRVANEKDHFERVRLSIHKHKISARCSCSTSEKLCAHGVAALLELAKRSPGTVSFMKRSGFDPEKGKSVFVEEPVTCTAMPLDRVSSSGPPVETLETVLHDFSETGLVLNSANLIPNMDSRWSKVTLQVELCYHGRSYSGSNLKRMVEGGYASGGMHLSDYSPQEQQIIRFLSLNTESLGSEFVLNAHQMTELLHCLENFPAFYAAGEPVHVHDTHLELLLLLKKSDEKTTVTPRISVPKHGLVPLQDATFIIGPGGYWLGYENEFWWLPGIIPPSWLRFFLKERSVVLQPEQLQLLESLCENRQIPAQLVPEESAHELMRKTGACRPVLLLDWQHSHITAILHFDYYGKRVDFKGPQVIWGRNRFVARDDKTEKKTAALLLDAGFTLTSPSKGEFRLEKAQCIWEFLEQQLPCWQKEKWHLYWTPNFVEKKQRSGWLKVEITAGAETDQWFELNCNFRTADSSLLQWDEISGFCRRGDCFVAGDGSGVLKVDSDQQNFLELLSARSMKQEENVFRLPVGTALPIWHALKPLAEIEKAEWVQNLQRVLHHTDLPKVFLPANVWQTLRDYQKEGVGWLKLMEETHFNGILADEMGLGKTIQALATVLSRKLAGKSGTSIVVCPTSLLENWFVEAQRFPELRTMIIRGSDRDDLIQTLPSCDLIITSYALLRRDVETYRAHEFAYVILDEAQHIKNPFTVNARACKELRAIHKLILTGTPVENSLAEVWSLFDFLLPGLLGTHQEFHRTYELPAKDEPQKVTARLAEEIRPFILRRTKAEVCTQLPPKMEQIVYCEFDQQQQLVYDKLLQLGRELLEEARREGWQKRRFEVFTLLLRLRQLCCHPSLIKGAFDALDVGDTPSAKTELLQEVILEAIDSSHRILLFSQFTSFLKLFKNWLDKEEIPYEYLDGHTKNRQERVDRFNRDTSIPIFLLSLKAGGTGLNLTGADTVIHYDQWWNPLVEDQATDRTHRIGQKRTVTAVKLLVHNTIEERVLKLQESKRILFDELLAGARAKLGNLTPEDVEFLLKIED